MKANAKTLDSNAVRIGQNLSRIRRERGITQVDLAQELDLPQQMISNYERGTIRLHGQLIVQLCQLFAVTADELLGLDDAGTASAFIGDRQLLRRVKKIDTLSRRDRQALLRTIDAFLAKAS